MLALGRAQGGGDSDVHGVFFRDFGVTLTESERCPRILVAFWEVYFIRRGFKGWQLRADVQHGDQGTVQ